MSYQLCFVRKQSEEHSGAKFCSEVTKVYPDLMNFDPVFKKIVQNTFIMRFFQLYFELTTEHFYQGSTLLFSADLYWGRKIKICVALFSKFCQNSTLSPLHFT